MSDQLAPITKAGKAMVERVDAHNRAFHPEWDQHQETVTLVVRIELEAREHRGFAYHLLDRLAEGTRKPPALDVELLREAAKVAPTIMCSDFADLIAAEYNRLVGEPPALDVRRVWPPEHEPQALDALAFAMWEANFDSVLSQRMMSVHGEATDSSYREAAGMVLDSLPPEWALVGKSPALDVDRLVKAAIAADRMGWHGPTLKDRQRNYAEAVAAEYNRLSGEAEDG